MADDNEPCTDCPDDFAAWDALDLLQMIIGNPTASYDGDLKHRFSRFDSLQNTVLALPRSTP